MVLLNGIWFPPFQQALVISDDGTTLQGTGNDRDFGPTDFVVTGFSLPEPSGGLYGAAALAALAALSRRRQQR